MLLPKLRMGLFQNSPIMFIFKVKGVYYMKKKLLFVMLVVIMSFMLTGCFECRITQKVTGDGIITETAKVCLNKQEYIDYINNLMNAKETPVYTEEAIDKDMKKEGFEIEVIDGTEYYVNNETSDGSSSTGTLSIEKWYKANQESTVKGSGQIWERGFILSGDKISDDDISDDVEKDMSSKEFKEAGINKSAMLQNYYMIYSVEFDSDIIAVDENGVIDSANPKKATWKLSFDKINKDLKLYALCNSDIQVSGVLQGNSYKKAVKLHYDGAVSAVCKGREIGNDTTFNKHGQHTVILKAASGEQRTVTFFIDRKKPVISKIKNNKTYKKPVIFKVSDKDSGVASVKIDGKKKNPEDAVYSIRKKGKHTIIVKDNVGNVKKVKIKIRY